MHYWIETFGCQMNVHDSDRMAEVLRANGWEPATTLEEAEVVVFNTCSVREKAEQKLRSEVGKLAPLKKRRPDIIVAVAGCVAQQEGENLLKRMPYIDLVIGPDNITELPALLEAQRAGAPPVARTVFDLDEPRFLSATAKERAVSAFVTTMKGCDERCSFCIVPTTRGPERYRKSDEIVDEVTRLVASGAREIVLLGQTVDSFRDPALPPPASDDPDESQFPALLARIANEVPRFDPETRGPGLLRLRYTSPHPRHATPALVRAHAEVSILARHLHLPVQSGSNRVLRRMIRRYTRETFIERARALLASREGTTMSTDMIVGFPGETDEDFEETLSLVREVGFIQVFGFKFSPRPGTPALRLGDDVPEAKKSERLARLFELVETQLSAHLATLVGSAATVLVEGASKTGESFAGRTERNEIVHIAKALLPEGVDPTGEVVAVEIRSANKRSLVGAPSEAEVVRLRTLPRVPRKPEKRALSVVA